MTPVEYDDDDLLAPCSGSGDTADGQKPSPRTQTPADASGPSGALISEAHLADLLDLTARRIRDLTQSGVIPKAGRGPAAFDRREAVRAYCRWVRDKASRGVTVMDDLKVEKIRQAREAADKLELQNAASRGELVKASEVEAAWSNVLRDVRAMMLAVSSRCGANLPHLTAHDVTAIDAEIKRALRGLADADA